MLESLTQIIAKRFLQDSGEAVTTTDVPNGDKNSAVVITNVVNFTILNVNDGSQLKSSNPFPQNSITFSLNRFVSENDITTIY